MSARATNRELYRALVALAFTFIVLTAVRGLDLGWIRRVHVYVDRDLSGDTRAKLLIGAMVVAISCAARALRAVRRGDATSLRAAVVVGGAAFTTAAVGWWVRVATLRAFAAAVLTRSPRAAQDFIGKIDPLTQVMMGIENEAWIVVLAGAALLALTALWGATGLVWARGRPDRGALVGGLAAVAALTAAGMVRSAAAVVTYSEGCGGYPDIVVARYESFAEYAALLSPLRMGVIGAALLGTVAILARARGAEARPERVPEARAAALFAAGLAAFAGTRAMAADTRHPMPLWEPFSVSYNLDDRLALPVTDEPCTYVDAPRLDVTPDGRTWIDGMLVGDAGEATKLLASKRALWSQVQPNKPFPGRLLAAISADAPIARAHAVAEIARNAGYPHLDGLARRPARSWPTRTLGEIPYTKRLCAVPIEGEIPQEGTWGQLVQASIR